MDIFSPIQNSADFFTYTIFGFDPASHTGMAVNFFIYDLIKISILLVLINYIMAIMRYYFPMEKVKDLLTKRRWFGLEYLLAAFLGVVTPFCSCSSIPLFIGFLGAGIPLGVTFAFLISSPLINEASLYLFPAMFGLQATLLYNGLGVGIAVLGGMLIQSLNLERYVKQDVLSFRSKMHLAQSKSGQTPELKKLMAFWWHDGWSITKKIFPYMVLGVGIGAVIHGFVPATLAEHYLSREEWWTVPLAALLGAPFYANSVSVIPVMEALVQKGVPLGTALAFMTAVVTVSIPELLILKRVMRWQLLAMFLSITLLGIMMIGLVLNAML